MSWIEGITPASDRLGTLLNSMALAEMGCRAQMIQRLTCAPMPEIKSVINRVGGLAHDKGGRQYRKIANLLDTVSKHVESSIMLKEYIEILVFYGGDRRHLNTDAFIRALMRLRAAVDSEFSPDQAWLVVDLFHTGEVALTRCSVCAAQYLVASAPQDIRGHITVGDCPLCRELATVEAGRTVVKIVDIRQQRLLISRLTGNGEATQPISGQVTQPK